MNCYYCELWNPYTGKCTYDRCPLDEAYPEKDQQPAPHLPADPEANETNA